MLNIGPTGLGGVPSESVHNLESVGEWLAVNGEAIYGTEKWKVTKEGPTEINMGGTGHREEHGFQANFTTKDFWFTHRDKSIYAISLTAPGTVAQIQSFGTAIGPIKQVNLLGHGPVEFEQTHAGLEVDLPTGFSADLGYVIEVTLH